MFNFAVISIKDMKKGIAKIFFLVFLLTVTISIINTTKSAKSTGVNFSFLGCLDICVPGLKQIEFEKKENFTLSKLLSAELPMSNYIIEKETDTTDKKQNDSNKIKENNKVQDKNDYEINIPNNVKTEVLQTNVPESYTDSFSNVNIKNGTDFELTDEMLTQEIIFKNPKKILIFHTHTCESYTPSEAFPYEMTGNYRTTDLNYSVARVGTELKNYLEASGFSVIHDMTCFDYPSYDESYDRAFNTITSTLQSNPDTEILFDIHRDAIADSSYAPTVKIGDEYAAQMMFVMGSNGAGQDHPNWIQNLNFAVKIQRKANEKYPGLFKPIILRNSRYNQSMAKGACLIEVGATGNTLEQCNNSMKYFADVLKDIL